MASAQVLSNSSRKQEHLEAGKRRLEEFRKKKAAERAKKVVPTSQLPSDVSLNGKQSLDIGCVGHADSDGAVSSDGHSSGVIESTGGVLNNDSKAISFGQKSVQLSSNDTLLTPPLSEVDYHASFADKVQTYAKDEENNRDDASRFAGAVDANYGQEAKEMDNDSGSYAGGQDRFSYGVVSDQPITLHSQARKDVVSSSSQSSVYGNEESQYKDNNNFLKNSKDLNPSSSHLFPANVSLQNSGSNLLSTKLSSDTVPTSGHTFSFYEDSTKPTSSLGGSSLEVGKDTHGSVRFNDPISFSFGAKTPGSAISGFPSAHNESMGFNSDARSSLNDIPLYAAKSETNSRKSRPSFLDSLNMHKASLGTILQGAKPEKESFMPDSSKSNGRDDLGSSASMNSSAGPFSKLRSSDAFGSSLTSNGGGPWSPVVYENSMEGKNGYFTSKQDENFSALEQHIEDLTQEKFSLQRALEAARALAESLATENSSLTDSYNQQRGVVNQLKTDMEMLQEDIKAYLVELESVKHEYANAQLECNAADERGKLLASEVIGLEEKALKLRSNELKLERQLENSNAEISSYKKKISTLDKDRRDLQLTIDALQEEKKLLQSKVRKASKSGKALDISKNITNTKEMSTSTEDLETADTIPDTLNQEIHETPYLPEPDAYSLPLLPENGELNLEVSPVNIPHDQLRMIQNINQLISELTLEKEELLQALTFKSSESSKLKDLNKELSRKLEVQTQRLELLTAQSMANEQIPVRRDAQSMPDSTTYADEGDEVVERVLGWIMKLFPGGPTKRRTSKLL